MYRGKREEKLQVNEPLFLAIKLVKGLNRDRCSTLENSVVKSIVFYAGLPKLQAGNGFACL
jgi:hypothetical protein